MPLSRSERAHHHPGRGRGWGRLSSLLPLALLLTACSGHGHATAATIPAVPFPRDDPWLEVSHPITLRQLRGRIVLLDFFTPGCINCVQMLPVLARLEESHPRSFTVIGIDSPKFTDSGTIPALRVFLAAHDVHEPVMLDRGLRLWNAYGIDAWPTFVLLGPRGHPRVAWVGETSYKTLLRAIDALRQEALRDHLLHPQPLLLRPLLEPRGILRWPADVAVGDGVVAIADTGANRVLVTTLRGRLEAIVGSGHPTRADGPPNVAGFDHPEGVAIAQGRIYVADTGNNLIREITLRDFYVRTIAGSGALGYARRARGPALSLPLNAPWGLLVRGDHLWIAMAGSHQIYRLNLRTHILDLWAGNGDEGLRGGPRHTAEFAQPTALASIPEQGLFVACPESSAIQRLIPRRGLVRILVGQGLFTWGDRDGSFRRARFQHPEGITTIGDRLYVADTFNGAIRVVDLTQQRVRTLVRGLDLPEGLSVLGQDRLLVAETGSSRLVTVNISTGRVRPWIVRSAPPRPRPRNERVDRPRR